MKPRSLPDWFAPVFAWLITAIVLIASATNPEGVYVNDRLKFFPLLLAVAWTAGFLAMRQFRSKFDAQYEDLGRPYLFGSPLEGSTWRFYSFLFGFRFLALKDRVVTAGFITMISLTIVGIFWLLTLSQNA